MGYEEAVKNVNYTEVAWEGLTALLNNEKLSIGLECLFASVERAKQTNEFNFIADINIVTSCLIELANHSAFKKIISDKNSPYFYLLDKALNGKTPKQVLDNLQVVLKCPDSQLAEILSLIPEEIFDSSIRY